MDELELWGAHSFLQSKGCFSGVVYEDGKDRNILLRLLIDVSSDFYDNTFSDTSKRGRINDAKVFMGEGGPPEFFAIPGFINSIIWYSKAFIGKHIKFRNLIMGQAGFEKDGIAAMFEALGSFYLSVGSEIFSRTCLFQSIIETSEYIRDTDCYNQVLDIAQKSCLATLPSEESEIVMVALYFGLAHEIGHVCGPTTRIVENRPGHPLELGREQIHDALVEAGKEVISTMELGVPGYFRDIWIAKLEREYNNPGSVFNIDRLRSEIEADWIGTQIIIRFMEAVFNGRERTYNKKILVSELVVGLFILQLIEQCKILSENNPTKINSLDELEKKRRLDSLFFPSTLVQDELLQSRAAMIDHIIGFGALHRVRVQFLRPTLETLVLIHLFPDTYATRGGVPVATVSDRELTRRHSIAAKNLEGYFGFYFDAFAQLMLRFEDVSLFSAHLFIDTPSDLSHLNPSGATDFADNVFRNFLIHLSRMEQKGEMWEERKGETIGRIKEYIDILERRGSADHQLRNVYYQLSNDGLMRKGE